MNEFPGAVSRTETLTNLIFLNHLGNIINFYHFTVIFLFQFYSEDDIWNVISNISFIKYKKVGFLNTDFLFNEYV